MTTYYEEYPTGRFLGKSDAHALLISKARVLYRESPTPDGTPFVVLRDEMEG